MLPPAHDAKTALPVRPSRAFGQDENGAKITMTLATRQAVAMVLLVAIGVSAVGWLSYRSLEQALLPRVLDRIETHARLVATELETPFHTGPADIATFQRLAAV